MTINTIEEIVVQARDMDEIRQVLAAVLNHFQATDLANAQMQMAEVRYRPLTNEVGLIKQRVDGYMGDFALRRMDALGWEDEEPSDDEEAPETADAADLEPSEPQEGSEGLTEASEEDVLEVPAMLPLGTITRGTRGARRLSKEELSRDVID